MSTFIFDDTFVLPGRGGYSRLQTYLPKPSIFHRRFISAALCWRGFISLLQAFSYFKGVIFRSVWVHTVHPSCWEIFGACSEIVFMLEYLAATAPSVIVTEIIILFLLNSRAPVFQLECSTSDARLPSTLFMRACYCGTAEL